VVRLAGTQEAEWGQHDERVIWERGRGPGRRPPVEGRGEEAEAGAPRPPRRWGGREGGRTDGAGGRGSGGGELTSHLQPNRLDL